MGEAQKGRSLNIGGEMEHGHHEHDHHRRNMYLDILPRDLLNRFMATSSDNRESNITNLLREDEGGAEEEEEEFELNLGLSLGGKFGVDKNKKKLTRSTSIASTLPIVRDDNDVMNSSHFNYPTLVKTSSLPTEREEEWRKRKELQTWRRMEAKRRRFEKQRKVDRASALTIGGISDKGLEEEERREKDGNINLRDNKQHMFASTASNRFDSLLMLPSWITAGIDGGDVELKGKGGFLGGSSSFRRSGQQPTSQGSVESQGGNSSEVSEFETKPVQAPPSGCSPSAARLLPWMKGVSSCGEARSSGGNQPLQEQECQEGVGSSGTNPVDNTSRTVNKGKEIRTNAMEDMPCVFTRGDGPNGRRVDGILYKYGKGEEVRIMCVCHGTFLSPAEFVKHAGGSDVEHPLRHIVVNPSAPSLS